MENTQREQAAGAVTDEAHVLQSQRGSVLWLTLNRPAQRNPLSSGMIEALHSAVSAANDNPAVRVIVLRGAGPMFSAGHDLREMRRRPQESGDAHRQRVRQVLESCAAMMLAITRARKAVIASVHGMATAAGLQLVSACDLAVADEQARFCTPGVNIGAFCTTPLVGVGRNVHRKHALELALTGDMFPAADALRFGLVNRVVPAGELDGEVGRLADTIASKSAQSIALGKAAFYRQVEMPLEEAFEYATQAMLEGLLAPDAAEGTAAFLEKRPPVWREA
ncbi:MAG: enoyl-CoA hydratase [Halieaceae bacterium]|nr:enoyl-CoA hydratase [Halieaceae bacterium]MCP5202980.1 enoyl-CoA hydratase [Pseudomonadales bacterium]